ncbi:MAG: hypothetical protein WCT28_04025 [Patescibacteria group bacterium]
MLEIFIGPDRYSLGEALLSYRGSMTPRVALFLKLTSGSLPDSLTPKLLDNVPAMIKSIKRCDGSGETFDLEGYLIFKDHGEYRFSARDYSPTLGTGVVIIEY